MRIACTLAALFLFVGSLPRSCNTAANYEQKVKRRGKNTATGRKEEEKNIVQREGGKRERVGKKGSRVDDSFSANRLAALKFLSRLIPTSARRRCQIG